MVITTAQLNSLKSELRFCTGSNLAQEVSDICDVKNLWQWSRLEIRHKRLSSVNHFAKTIHYCYHHYFKKLSDVVDKDVKISKYSKLKSK